MEIEAVKDQDKIDNPDDTEETTDVEPEAEGGDGAGEGAESEDSTGDGQEDDGEVELVREGDTQPQQQGTPRGFLKRINKLNGKVEVAKQETAEEREKRLFLEDENRVLKVALEQAKAGKPQTPDAPPNPDEYEGGTYDPEYIKQANEYNDKVIQAKVAEGIKQATQQTTVTANQQEAAQVLEKAQTDHYKRAAKLKVKDYEATEDKAIEIFGNDHTNHLIANLDNSEVAMYYFGKNPEVAQKYQDMLTRQPIKALIEIGGLLKEIKVKPKSEPAPDPDIELEGGSPSNLEAMQTKLNKMRDAARSGKGKLRDAIIFKRQCEEKGAKLR